MWLISRFIRPRSLGDCDRKRSLVFDLVLRDSLFKRHFFLFPPRNACKSAGVEFHVLKQGLARCNLLHFALSDAEMGFWNEEKFLRQRQTFFLVVTWQRFSLARKFSQSSIFCVNSLSDTMALFLSPPPPLWLLLCLCQGTLWSIHDHTR